jgi:hypothetical protein
VELDTALAVHGNLVQDGSGVALSNSITDSVAVVCGDAAGLPQRSLPGNDISGNTDSNATHIAWVRRPWGIILTSC